MCKTSKYAAPHASNVSRHNSQEGKKKKRNNRITTENSLFFLISQDKGQMNAGAAYAVSFSIRVYVCVCVCVCMGTYVIYICVGLSFLCDCVPNIKCAGSSHEIYYIHTVCIFKKKKRLQTVKIYCTVKLAKIMTTVRKKIIRAKFGSGRRIL